MTETFFVLFVKILPQSRIVPYIQDEFSRYLLNNLKISGQKDNDGRKDGQTEDR